MSPSLWALRPRGLFATPQGAKPGAMAPQAECALPLPGTIAGAVRAALAGDRRDLSRDEAQKLLQVAVVGPLLWHLEHGLLLPRPLDLVGEEAGTPPYRLAPLAQLGGALWPQGEALTHAAMIRERTLEGKKIESPKAEFIPLEGLLRLLFRDSPVEFKGFKAAQVIASEPRVRLKIDPATRTAEPTMLFTTPGLRLADGWSFLVEVRDPEPGRERPKEVALGGGGHVAAVESVAALRPPFPEAELQAAFEEGHALRVQLLTPGCFAAGWRPEALPGLRLIAACVGRPSIASGWQLGVGGEKGRPRVPRRLVPAGSVYYYQGSHQARLDAARALWWNTLEGCAAQADTLLAAAAHDGYGLALSGATPIR